MSEKSEKKTVWRVGARDLFFAAGLVMVFAGLWLLSGPGMALTVCGSLLLLMSIVSAWTAAPRVG